LRLIHIKIGIFVTEEMNDFSLWSSTTAGRNNKNQADGSGLKKAVH
jgi:hypothetical protein